MGVGVFNNFVEIGRVAYVSIGPFKHRLVAIVDGARTGTVRKAWAAAKIDEQWKESALYKSIIARRTRASLNDFERFKLSKAKKAKITRSTRPIPHSRRLPKHKRE